MTRTRNVLVGMLLAAVAVACGDDSSDDGADTATEGADSSAVAQTTAAPATTEAADTSATPETTAAPQTTAAPETTAAPTTAAPTSTEAPVEPLRILLTNDDGIGSEGIDAVATALAGLDGVELTLVAPAENQSGSSNSVSDPAPESAEAVTTLSGLPGLAVPGTPADSINYAFGHVFDEPPHLVVSGSNEGQNIGPFTPLSGTVGAARTAGAQGVPGFAISQGLVTEGVPDFATGLPYLVEWIEANREPVLAFDGTVAPVWSMNIPSCAGTGTVRSLVEGLPIAAEIPADVDPFTSDCASTLEGPADDVIALVNGFATLTQVPEDLVLAPPA